MKKLLLILFISSSILIFAQETQKDSVSQKTSSYISAGLSMSNSNNFSAGSYPSVEIGLMGKNIAAGFIVGRNNFIGIGQKSDAIGNGFIEGKTSISRQISQTVMIYSLCGVGTYGDFKHMFIEYGIGFSHAFNNKFSYFIQSSNWDNTWYITPGLYCNL